MTNVKKKATDYYKSHATIWIPRAIHQEMKVAAATSGMTMKDFLIKCIRKSLEKIK